MNSVNFKLLLICVIFVGSDSFAADPVKDEKVSVEYFNQMSRVLMHPRCLNCHPAGPNPTQGNQMRIHQMGVERGKDDHGAVGMRCATCHQAENNASSGVPGAPKWALAPLNMAWVGLSKGDLCRRLKDPKHNGGFVGEKLIHHMGEDKLVGWAWNPGAGREPVPGTQKEFGELTKRWLETGAACPP